MSKKSYDKYEYLDRSQRCVTFNGDENGNEKDKHLSAQIHR